ncbi:MAG: hypothetical protein JWM35_1889 [Verrucomicrobia bacterium]|nr:hypothetical protein [Verrucomicrobiota bacterium]
MLLTSFPVRRGGAVSFAGRGLLALVLFSIASVVAAHAADERKTFDVPAGDASRTLKQLAQQAGQQVVYPAAEVRGVKTAAVKGDYTLKDALQEMLVGTGLVAAYDESSRTFAVSKAGPNVPSRLASVPAATVERVESGAIQLDPYSVYANRPMPFSDANVDRPRTIDDEQPYYIFDNKRIVQSGAASIGDFLKQRLPMNATAGNSSQSVNNLGNVSDFNLRGIGSDKTLILINGRRGAGTQNGSVFSQTDLNGIPLNAIERIEVLPTSAAGIYGGSALGGVINVILRKDYKGGEIRATYDNTFDTDSAVKTLALNYGFPLEGGKTHVMLNASMSRSNLQLLQDRLQPFKDTIAQITANAPTFFSGATGSGTFPWLGSVPNIVNGTATATTLMLKDGRVLNTRYTHITPGTAPGQTIAAISNQLAANAGSWVLDFPNSTLASTGLLRPLGSAPKVEYLRGTVQRQMLPRLEVFAEFTYASNHTDSLQNPLATTLLIPATAPTNPFLHSVRVSVPGTLETPLVVDSNSRTATLGAIAKLPWGWTGEMDYTWTHGLFKQASRPADSTSFTNAGNDGSINPFFDVAQFPTINWEPYLGRSNNRNDSYLDDYALRGSGPLPGLPWATRPTLTIGLERRTQNNPHGIFITEFPNRPAGNFRTDYFKREQRSDSGYAEVNLPLVKKDQLPLLRELDLQLANRVEYYSVSAGTSFVQVSATTVSFGGPTLNGQPYFSKAKYDSDDYTVGLRYRPLRDVTLRASSGTAFLPPTATQLIKNPVPNPTTTTVTDPKNGNASVSGVQTLGGGNPDLKPQSSKSTNVGLIWEPRQGVLHGLRLDLEYYRIKQSDFIGSLSPQLIVNNEAIFPGRVIRNAAGTITLVDISSQNLYERDSNGWDLTAEYARKTAAGTFTFALAGTRIDSLRNQYSLTLPSYEGVNYPNEGGALKYRGNASLYWEWRRWSTGWTATYYHGYKQQGAAGGPASVQFDNGAQDNPAFAILPQGGENIPSQMYHDAFVQYAFDSPAAADGAGQVRRLAGRALEGVSITLGIRNIFNKVPPLDAVNSTTYYRSLYGDSRLRSYWITVQKKF